MKACRQSSVHKVSSVQTSGNPVCEIALSGSSLGEIPSETHNGSLFVPFHVTLRLSLSNDQRVTVNCVSL